MVKLRNIELKLAENMSNRKILIFDKVMGQKVPKTPIIPYIGIRFLAISELFLWPIGLKFFMGTQETIIYRLVVRNNNFGPYLPF